jgi:hypothetical protein
MQINFIKTATLNWVLVRETDRGTASFTGSSYHNPHIILKRSEVSEDTLTKKDSISIKKYSPGLYR